MASSCNKNRMRMIFGGFDNYDADDYDGDDDHDYGDKVDGQTISPWLLLWLSSLLGECQDCLVGGDGDGDGDGEWSEPSSVCPYSLLPENLPAAQIHGTAVEYWCQQ